VLALRKPVVCVLFSGRPIAMPSVFARAAAVVAAWFPGTEAGRAVADLLTGREAPSAGLPVTWPRHVGQVPIVSGPRSGGRPEMPGSEYTSKYLDLPNSPQFFLGHGLSYTAFRLTDPIVAVGDTITVETELANTGDRAGAATVFLFLHDPVARIARPELELKHFTRIELAAGDRQTVRIELIRADLVYLGPSLDPVIEPGAYEVHVGLSADPAGLRSARFVLD
jgi:beta-glucosidase